MSQNQPRHTGLTESEARRRLATEGPNELPGERRRGLISISLEVLREPMFMLLSAGGVIYVALGDIREALVLLLSVVVVTGITIYQTRKTERALDALRDLSSPRALVVRDGMPGASRVVKWYAATLCCCRKAIASPRMHGCWRPMIFRSTRRCSPASRCRCVRSQPLAISLR